MKANPVSRWSLTLRGARNHQVLAATLTGTIEDVLSEADILECQVRWLVRRVECEVLRPLRSSPRLLVEKPPTHQAMKTSPSPLTPALKRRIIALKLAKTYSLAICEQLGVSASQVETTWIAYRRAHPGTPAVGTSAHALRRMAKEVTRA